MPIYKFTNRETGETAQLQSDTLPSEQQVDALFAQKRNAVPVTASATSAPGMTPDTPEAARQRMDWGSWEPAPQPAESAASYISRSPIVGQAAGAVAGGAALVGQGAQIAGRDAQTGWNAVAAPVTGAAGYVGSELARTGGDINYLGGRAADYVGQNVVQPAAAWWQRNVVPPPLPQQPQPMVRTDAQPPVGPPPATNYPTAINRKTGERIIFKDGKWTRP